jgi:hypothetical protein
MVSPDGCSDEVADADPAGALVDEDRAVPFEEEQAPWLRAAATSTAAVSLRAQSAAWFMACHCR